MNEKQPNRIFAQRSLDGQVVGEIAAIAILHDEIDIVLRLFAVEQRDNILMVQLGELFENFDLFAQEILRFGQALLGDALYGDGEVGFLCEWKRRLIDLNYSNENR